MWPWFSMPESLEPQGNGTVIVWSTGVPRCLGAGEDATGGRLKSELPGAVEIQPALA